MAHPQRLHHPLHALLKVAPPSEIPFPQPLRLFDRPHHNAPQASPTAFGAFPYYIYTLCHWLPLLLNRFLFHRFMYPVDGLQENKDLLQKMLSGIHLEGRKGIARYWQCESNSIRSGKKMPHVQESLSLHSGCIAYIHRPTQGWTVREYILTLQSMLASSTVQPWVGRSRTTPFPV